MRYRCACSPLRICRSCFSFSFAARTCLCSLVVATFAVARHDKVGLVLARTHLSFPPRVHIRDSQADADLQWAAYALIPDPRSPIPKLYSEAEDLQQMALVTHKMFEGTCSLVLIMVQASSSFLWRFGVSPEQRKP